MNKQKPSEIVESFLSFLEESNAEHIDCGKVVELCNKKNIDYLHDMEFAKDKNERNRIATKIHQNQVTRRLAKDREQELKNIAVFYSDQKNRPFIGQLKRLVKDQKGTEDYLSSEREYIRRAGGKDDCD